MTNTNQLKKINPTQSIGDEVLIIFSFIFNQIRLCKCFLLGSSIFTLSLTKSSLDMNNKA